MRTCLGLSAARTTHILEFLIQAGLIIQDGSRFKTGTVSVHLGTDSGMLSKHHTNWRMQAIQSLERESDEDLHYSSAVTISTGDLPQVRKILVAAIEEIRAVVRASPEEGLYCYALDLFKVCGQA